ncbi:unnamed protein product (macronuclear) [Paramecium tetraurelia]|uniref:Uncharacterized protein n=1 Tax=Paramecium tetraurelia TaxID=5888 RepID=A0C2I1_PARTE|nr:uncharacterized protein GSPATT00034476001 [Paramecium tetraurelia]CAK64998.1 unnamed protein product [Paramecium tetraurelia]|eukprot:XP_001432395.1 hypothetical protein (macronuclear) [Paramecium tetraurelia strain d4-2]
MLKPTCIYDLQELFAWNEKANYSSYTNFMRHTYRKLINIKGFYLDEDIRKINDVIWNTYNKFNIQSSKVAVFEDGSQEAVLPEYSIRMYCQNVEEQEVKQDDDNFIDQPKEIMKFQLPLLPEFEAQEYAELLEQDDRREEKHHDDDILLRRYNLQVKSGDQVAVSINVMGIILIAKQLRIGGNKFDEYLIEVAVRL